MAVAEGPYERLLREILAPRRVGGVLAAVLAGVRTGEDVPLPSWWPLPLLAGAWALYRRRGRARRVARIAEIRACA